MTARQPFTQLCQQMARGPRAGRADLHLHTTASDGAYTPEQIVELARRSGLAAVAITDHDTLAGLPAARAAAEGSAVTVIAGAEISCEFRGRELHLLAYFVDPGHSQLNEALAAIRAARVERFHAMLERLRAFGVSIDGEASTETPDALGRPHLARLLVEQGKAATVREAFVRFLGDGGPVAVPKKRLAVEAGIELVRAAGGVAAWAHPLYDGSSDGMAELARLGLGAVEVDYPGIRRSQSDELRRRALALGLAVTAGSDCHGPGKKPVGACTVSDEELARLQRLARGGECSAPSSIRSSKD
jgi:predicted metal-dependent phosphoesterase TrpH